MSKLINIAGTVVLGVCIYGAYKKTFEWGCEYVSEDVNTIVEFGKKLKRKVQSKVA